MPTGVLPLPGRSWLAGDKRLSPAWGAWNLPWNAQNIYPPRGVLEVSEEHYAGSVIFWRGPSLFLVDRSDRVGQWLVDCVLCAGPCFVAPSDPAVFLGFTPAWLVLAVVFRVYFTHRAFMLRPSGTGEPPFREWYCKVRGLVFWPARTLCAMTL